MKTENNSEQMEFLQFVDEQVSELEEIKKTLRPSAQAILKILKEFLALTDRNPANVPKVKELQERLFGLF